MVRGQRADPGGYVRRWSKLGFESIEPFFWQTMDKDLPRLADEFERGDRRRRRLDRHARHVRQSAGGRRSRPPDARGWEALIDTPICSAPRRSPASPVACAASRSRTSLPRFKEVWGELARRAADKGVRLAFENCAMDGNWASGDWNIAHNPDAWELMFNALPDDNLGLEWEPCHQLVYLIDPMPQIRKWAPKFFHVHGKDATVRWDVIREHGVFGKVPFVQMRTPGLRRQRLDARHQRAAARGLSRLDRHRRLARSGLSRRTGDDRPGSRAQLSQELPRRRAMFVPNPA